MLTPCAWLFEWEKKRDPSQDDKIGPAIERVIGALGLISKPDPKHGKAKPESEPEPPESEESYWAAWTRHEKRKRIRQSWTYTSESGNWSRPRK